MLTLENRLQKDVLRLLEKSPTPRRPEEIIKIIKDVRRGVDEAKIRETLFQLMNLKLVLLTADLRLSTRK